MPYSTNNDLPEELKKLPSAAQTMFRQAFNKAYERGNGESSSFKIAWEVVKKRFKKQNGTWVAKSDAFSEIQYQEFSLERADEFVTRSAEGETMYNYVLSDVHRDLMGTAPTLELLQEWAQTLNKQLPEVDVDHELYRMALKQYGGNYEAVERATQHKKGIAKVASAFVEGGRLIVSLVFDKRYSRFVNKIKGASIEGFFKKNAKGLWEKGKLLGLSLLEKENPGNPRSKRIIM